MRDSFPLSLTSDDAAGRGGGGGGLGGELGGGTDAGGGAPPDENIFAGAHSPHEDADDTAHDAAHRESASSVESSRSDVSTRTESSSMGSDGALVPTQLCDAANAAILKATRLWLTLSPASSSVRKRGNSPPPDSRAASLGAADAAAVGALGLNGGGEVAEPTRGATGPSGDGALSVRNAGVPHELTPSADDPPTLPRGAPRPRPPSVAPPRPPPPSLSPPKPLRRPQSSRDMDVNPPGECQPKIEI